MTSAAVCMDALSVVLVFPKCVASVDVRPVIVTIRIPSTARAVATVVGTVVRRFARPFLRSGGWSGSGVVAVVSGVVIVIVAIRRRARHASAT